VEKAEPGTECALHLSSSHEIAYSPSDRFLLANLDAKQRFAGYGFAEN
jgi:hypothetical protein